MISGLTDFTLFIKSELKKYKNPDAEIRVFSN